jgi:hypothetical protein
VQTRASVQNAASGPGKGCSTRATTGRTGETLTQASQTSPPTCNVRGAAGAGLDRALGPPRAGALGDGVAPYQARSGGGPDEGFLADTCWGNGRWGHGELQMPEDLPDHTALRDGGDDLQPSP